MTRRFTDAPHLTSKEALHLYLTGVQDAPVRHHVVSRSYVDTRSTVFFRYLVELVLILVTVGADLGNSIPQLLTSYPT